MWTLTNLKKNIKKQDFFFSNFVVFFCLSNKSRRGVLFIIIFFLKPIFFVNFEKFSSFGKLGEKTKLYVQIVHRIFVTFFFLVAGFLTRTELTGFRIPTKKNTEFPIFCFFGSFSVEMVERDDWHFGHGGAKIGVLFC